MIAKIIYKLPDERMDFIIAVKADDMLTALLEIERYLRSAVKYGPEQTQEQIRQMFYEILTDNDINMDNLTE